MDEDIIVASTTSTQEELDHAASQDWRVSPEVTPKPEEKKDEPPVVSEPEKGETAAESETAKTESAKKPESKAEKRIRELTRDREHARKFGEEQAEKTRLLEERLAKLEQAKPEPIVADEDKDKEPKFANYKELEDGYEKFLSAHARWDARQEFKTLTLQQQQEAEEAEAAEQQQAEATRTKAVFDAYNERVDEAREQFPDWDTVINRADIPMTEGTRLAIFEMENGPEIGYYLGKHPDEAHALFQMSTPRAMAEIGRISAKLQKIVPTPEPKPVSSAAAPIKPVGRSGTTSAKTPDSMSMEEYNQWRDAQSSRNR